MKYVEEDDTNGGIRKYVDTEEVCLDGDEIRVISTNGFGQTNVYIESGYITWKQLDKLKEAIADAERRWRP